jgi:hypothetical protein
MLLAHGSLLLVVGRAGPENEKAPSGSRRRGLSSKWIRWLLAVHLVPSRAHDDDDDSAESASPVDEVRRQAKGRIGRSASMRLRIDLSNEKFRVDIVNCLWHQ